MKYFTTVDVPAGMTLKECMESEAAKQQAEIAYTAKRAQNAFNEFYKSYAGQSRDR